MIRVFRHHLAGPSVLLWLIELALLSAFYRVFAGYIGLDMLLSAATASRLNYACLMAAVFSVLVNTALGLYNRDIMCDGRVMAVRLSVSFLINIVLLTIFTALVLIVLSWPQLPIYAVPLGLIAAFVCLGCLRFFYLNIIDRIHFQRRVLVIGAGERAIRLLDRMTDKKGHHFRVVGVVGVEGEQKQLPTIFTIGKDETTTNQFWQKIEAFDPDELVIAVDNRRILPIEPLLYCKFRGIDITEFLTFVERELGRVNIEDVTPSWLIFSDGFWVGLSAKFWKRLFDVVVSTVFLALFLPVIVLTAIVIRLQGDGPVLFRQERVGQDNNQFTLVKFRTMKAAPPDAQPKWAAVNDSRITVAGRIMRSTRIDEIPQIFNVLKGDMSFVGPRPEQPFFVSVLQRAIPYYRERHLVKPGITGWAQINYPYGASVDDARQKLAFDLYYVKNASLFLDFLIILQTVRVVIWPEGAR